MPFDPVPWAVAGGSHSADVARLLAYVAGNKEEGILEPFDLEVRELDVPGSSVRVMPGGATIWNRTPGYEKQSYVMLAKSETEVAIAPTGSGGGRSDMIMAIVKDPTLSGSPWDAPPDPLVGPYVEPHVESGVSPSATTVDELGYGYSAIPLARIDIPASTATITQSMIVDLRGNAGSSGGTAGGKRQTRELKTYSMVSTEPNQIGTAGGEWWPNEARWDIEIPAWATRAVVVGCWAQVLEPGTNVSGELWISISDPADTNPNQVTTQVTRYNTDTGVARNTYVNSGTLVIPASMRGETMRFGLRARRISGTGNVEMTSTSALYLDIQFQESPDTGQI